MKCKFCNAELEEGAVYCPNCGKSVESDSETATVSTPPQSGEANNQGNQQPASWKKTVSIIGACCAAAAVVVSLIFVFLTGIVYSTPVGNMAKVDISYFFKDATELIKGIMDRMSAAGGEQSVIWQLYGDLMQILFGYILFVAVVIAMIVVVCFAVSRFIKYFTGNPGKKSIGASAIGAYSVYALGAALLRSFYVSVESYGGESAGWQYNAMTKAGLAIGGVLVALYAVSKIVVNGKELLNRLNIVRLSLCAAIIVFVALLWQFSTQALVGVSREGLSATYGFFSLIQTGELGSASVVTSPDQLTAKIVMNVMFCIMGAVFLICTICTLRAVLTRTFERFTEGENKSIISKAIPVVILAVLTTICAIVAGKSVALPEGASAVITGAILTSVFAVIILVLAIVESVLSKKFAEDNN